MGKDLEQKVAKQLNDYVDALLALEVLDKEQHIETLTVETAKGIIEHNNAKGSTYIDVINDLVNAHKEKIDPEKPFIVTIGNEAYQVTVKGEGNKKEVHIEKKLAETSDGLAMVPVDKPKVVIKQGKTVGGKQNFEVKIGNRVVFDQNSPRPNDLQRYVIQEYAKKIAEGNASQLVVMGTATGKSFVLAGVTHATEAGVFIVPDADLAKEMTTTISKMQGEGVAKKLQLSTSLTVAEFEKALEKHAQVILLADDKDFAEKAALLQNKVVLVDESHKHAYKEAGQEILRKLKSQNILLAVTGTPSAKLKKVMGNYMLDINVRAAMDRGDVRQVRPLHERVPKKELVYKTLLGYFGRDVYWSEGKGVISLDGINGIRAMLAKGVKETDAIDIAIRTNRERASCQKNFFFSGSDKYRTQVLEAYQQVQQGNYAGLEKLQREVALARFDAELKERIRLTRELHSELSEEEARDKVLGFEGKSEEDKALAYNVIIANLPPVSLVEECKVAQCEQIANTMNAVTLGAIFGMDYTVIERKQRMVEFAGFVKNLDCTSIKRMSEHEFDAMLDKNLEKTFTDLPKIQRKHYIHQVKMLAKHLYYHIQVFGSLEEVTLLTGKNVNLAELCTSYARAVRHLRTKQHHSAMILDELRAGLVMHVFSDQKYTTGISIRSVLSVQQLITTDTYALTSTEDTQQLHARNIRDSDRGALNMQLVDESVPQDEYVKVEDVFSHNSGKLMVEFEEHMEQKDAARREQIESKKQQNAAEDEAKDEDAVFLRQQSTLLEDLNVDSRSATPSEIALHQDHKAEITPTAEISTQATIVTPRLHAREASTQTGNTEKAKEQDAQRAVEKTHASVVPEKPAPKGPPTEPVVVAPTETSGAKKSTKTYLEREVTKHEALKSKEQRRIGIFAQRKAKADFHKDNKVHHVSPNKHR